MLNANEIKDGHQYDLICKNGVTLFGVKAFKVAVGMYLFEVPKQKDVQIFSDNLGLNNYWQVYPAGVGQQLEDIRGYIKNHKRQNIRFEALRDGGYVLEPKHMGRGGVGQLKATKEQIRIQVGAGFTRWNLAMCVVLPRM